jgi:methionyl-tRNA formyltransferase
MTPTSAIGGQGTLTSRCIRVVLLGLTGLANEVLHALLRDPRVHLVAVFTETYPTPFPYYKVPQLEGVCQQKGLACNTGLNVSRDRGFEMLLSTNPDLVLMAGFHQMLGAQVISLPPLGVVNIHSSLLPKYRGAVPEQTALLNGDNETGVTYHYVTERMDDGNILLQERYTIAGNETIGDLRQGLAGLASSLVPRLIDLFENGAAPVGTPQSGSVSFAPKRYSRAVPLEAFGDVYAKERAVRALVPYPGVTIRLGEGQQSITGASFFSREMKHPSPRPRHVDLEEEGQVLRLYL